MIRIQHFSSQKNYINFYSFDKMKVSRYENKSNIAIFA